jgi:transposase
MNKEFKDKITSDVAGALIENEKLDNWTKDYEFEGRRLVVSYSKKRANKDKKDRDRLVERIKKKMTNGKVRLSDLINNTGTKKYLKIEKKGIKEATLNESKIELDSKWDGIHGVITNHSDNNLSSEEILNRYRGLWQIEAAFRVNKHDLKMRPIYHWTPKRIKAHILICFIAYSLAAFVKYKLNKAKIKLSFEEIRNELSRLQASIVSDKKTGRRFILPSKTTQNQKSIYKAFGLVINENTRLLKK